MARTIEIFVVQKQPGATPQELNSGDTRGVLWVYYFFWRSFKVSGERSLSQ